jgi:KaiC/GvpD/RAD55 family RecA-like ATPase
MFETKVLHAFIHSRSDYDHAKDHIDTDTLSVYGAALLALVEDYYRKDETADHVDIELLNAALDRKFADIKKHREKARDMLEMILAEDTSAINVVAEVLEQKRAQLGTQLADALFSQDNERIRELWQPYEQLTDATTLEGGEQEEYQNLSLTDLFAAIDEQGVWKVAPKELNDRIKGGLRAGHHMVVAARPERGKTLFGINFLGGFLEQGAKVLYIGNEDPMNDLILRLTSHLTGWVEEHVKDDPDTATDKARAKGYGNCVFAGLSPGTLYEVEALIRRHEPDIVIVDQMRNIRAKTENNTQRLEVVAQELRNMARRHSCVMVSMTQVGDSGRDKLVLNDGDIDGSNTGIPGACDVIVMIGSNDEFELRDTRHLTLAKNKRGGNHDSFTVSVDRGLSRVYSRAG